MARNSGNFIHKKCDDRKTETENFQVSAPAHGTLLEMDGHWKREVGGEEQLQRLKQASPEDQPIRRMGGLQEEIIEVFQELDSDDYGSILEPDPDDEGRGMDPGFQTPDAGSKDEPDPDDRDSKLEPDPDTDSSQEPDPDDSMLSDEEPDPDDCCEKLEPDPFAGSTEEPDPDDHDTTDSDSCGTEEPDPDECDSKLEPDPNVGSTEELDPDATKVEPDPNGSTEEPDPDDTKLEPDPDEACSMEGGKVLREPHSRSILVLSSVANPDVGTSPDFSAKEKEMAAAYLGFYSFISLSFYFVPLCDLWKFWMQLDFPGDNTECLILKRDDPGLLWLVHTY